MAWTPRSDTGGGNWAVYFRVLARRSTKAAAQAARPNDATLTATLDGLTVSASGFAVVASPLAIGSLSSTLDTVTASASARLLMSGSFVQSLGSLTSVASGGSRIGASASVTLGAVTVGASSAIRISGSASQTLGTLTLVASSDNADISAPTLRVYNGSTYGSSASGVSDPPLFEMDIPSDAGEGDLVQFEIDTANTFNTGNLRDEELLLGWDGTDFILLDPDTHASANFTIQTGLTPSTTYYCRRRIRRDAGDDSIYSDWSSTVTVSVSASGVTFGWNSSDQATWGGGGAQVVSGTNSSIFTVSSAAAGARSAVRGTSSFSSGKTYFRVVRSGTALLYAGVATATYGDGSGTIDGVLDADSNTSQTVWLQGVTIYVGGVSTGVSLGTTGTETVGIAVDATNDKVWFQVGASWDGDPVAGTGGRSIPAAAVKALGVVFPQSGQSGVLTIDTLANATSNCPSGFTPAGA